MCVWLVCLVSETDTSLTKGREIFPIHSHNAGLVGRQQWIQQQMMSLTAVVTGCLVKNIKVSLRGLMVNTESILWSSELISFREEGVEYWVTLKTNLSFTVSSFCSYLWCLCTELSFLWFSLKGVIHVDSLMWDFLWGNCHYYKTWYR